jgi:hypothetical protein
MDKFDERQARINALQQLLENTDYKVRKFLDGEYTREEYDEIAEKARAWRAEKRTLEAEIESEGGAQ